MSRGDLISLLPKLESHSLWESLLVPLAASAASSMYLISLTNTQQTKTAFANEQLGLDLLIDETSANQGVACTNGGLALLHFHGDVRAI